jgi:putative glycosyltransferase (TIGR04372 family)
MNLKTIIKRILKYIIYISAFPFASFVMFLLNLFRPTKVEFLVVPRIGHVALNTELILRRRKLGIIDKNQRIIFVPIRGPISNSYLYKMWKRVITIIDNPFLREFFLSLQMFSSRYANVYPMHMNEYHEFNNASPCLSFTDEEKREGDDILKKMGIGQDDWFVCIFSRDSAYLSSVFTRGNFSYLDFRDANIDSYAEAVKYIIDKGGWVIRLGKVVAKKMDFEHPRFIDYPFSEFRSDFMDIYLQYKCKYVISDTSGICTIALIFDIPFVGVNMIPIDVSLFGKNSIYIPKKLKRKENDKWLSLNDYFELLGKKDLKGKDKACYVHSDFYKNEGFEIVDNSPEEILDVAKEMLDKLDGRYTETETEKNMQDKYQIIHLRSFQYSQIKTPIGKDFLKKNYWYIN